MLKEKGHISLGLVLSGLSQKLCNIYGCSFSSHFGQDESHGFAKHCL